MWAGKRAAITLTVALAVVAAGCAGGGGTRTGGPASTPAGPAAPSGMPAAAGRPATPAQTPFRLCGPPHAPGRLIAIPAADGVRLAAIEAGAGGRGVVLIPESGAAGKCGWWDYAAYLAAKGFHVLTFDHRCTGSSGCPSGAAHTGLMSDVRGAVTRLQQEGVRTVALVGASQGGAEALIAAAVDPKGVTGVVALSADELTLRLAGPPYPATAVSAARRVRLPVLFVVARTDPYVSVRDTRHLFGVTTSHTKDLAVLRAGSGHGWDLLVARAGARPPVSRRIVAFLRGVTS